MKIVLINPSARGAGTEDHSADMLEVDWLRWPPYGLWLLATLAASQGIEAEIIDGAVEKIEVDKINADLVGITAMTARAPMAYKIADGLRCRGIKVVIGGIHASVCPEEALAHADAIFIGEADETWLEALYDFRLGNLKKVYKPEALPNLELYPVFDYDLVRHPEKYSGPRPIQCGRGCPVDCDFCSVAMFNGTKYRNRSIGSIMAEISSFKKKPIKKILALLSQFLFFIDDNIVGNPKWAKEFFSELQHLDVKWFSQSSLLIAQRRDLLEAALRSGCKAVFIGFESVNKKGLDSVNKTYPVAKYEELCKILRSEGLVIYGEFILGLDTDSKDDIRRTTEFALKNVDLAQFSVLTPFPGTRLFQKLFTEKRIISMDWSRYDCGHVVIQPKNMSPDELSKELESAYATFYKESAIWLRALKRLFINGQVKSTISSFIMNKMAGFAVRKSLASETSV